MRDTLRIMAQDLRLTRNDLWAILGVIGGIAALTALFCGVIWFCGWLINQLLPFIPYENAKIGGVAVIFWLAWYINANDRAVRERNAKRFSQPREYDDHL